MKLLLANAGLYQQWVDRGATKFTGFDSEAYNAAQAADYGEYFASGSDAIIQVCGPLSYKYDFWSWLMDGSSYQGLMAQIQSATNSTEISRIVLLMDTPGGEITGLPEASQAIANCGKPTVAVVDPCCASAGLWLASQADRIVSIESGEIGSLGVQCMAVSYAKMLEEKGLDARLVRAAISPDKNIAHPYEPLSDEAMEYLQDRVDKAGERFVATVAAGRNVSTADVLAKFGQGKMLDAETALDVGLIDQIGTLAGVLAESRTGSVAAKTNRRRAEYRRSR